MSAMVNMYTQKYTHTHTDAAVHVNELSMEQWWVLILMNTNEGTKIEGAG